MRPSTALQGILPCPMDFSGRNLRLRGTDVADSASAGKRIREEPAATKSATPAKLYCRAQREQSCLVAENDSAKTLKQQAERAGMLRGRLSPKTPRLPSGTLPRRRRQAVRLMLTSIGIINQPPTALQGIPPWPMEPFSLHRARHHPPAALRARSPRPMDFTRRTNRLRSQSANPADIHRAQHEAFYGSAGHSAVADGTFFLPSGTPPCHLRAPVQGHRSR